MAALVDTRVTTAPSRSSFVFLLYLGMACPVSSAPQLSVQAGADNYRAVASTWHRIDSARLTPDGKWLVYVLRAQAAGEGTVILRNTASTEERRYSAGDVSQHSDWSRALQISASGRWIAYLRGKSAEDEQAGHSAARGAPDQGRPMVLIDAVRGTTAEFQSVARFAFNSQEGRAAALRDWIAVHYSDAAGRRLSLRELDGNFAKDLPATQEFAFNAPGTRFAWIDESGAHTYSLQSRELTDLDSSDGVSLAGLTWSRKGNALAFFRGCTGAGTEPIEPPSNCSIVAFWGLDSSSRRALLRPGAWDSFPRGYNISSDAVQYPYVSRAPLTWREDETGLFFGVRHGGNSPEPSENDVAVVWRSADSSLPGTDEARAIEQKFSFLGFVHLPSRRFIRLADEVIREVEPHPRARYLLGFASAPYDRHLSLTGHRSRDYYLIDVETGERTLLAEGLVLPLNWVIAPDPMLSPDGAFVVYHQAGDYIAFDVARKTHRNLTAQLPIRFTDPLDQQSRVRQRPHVFPVFRGWGDGGRTILLSDHYDMWSLPLAAGDGTNLTARGRRDGIIFVPTRLESAGEYPSGEYDDMRSESVSLSDDIYFRILDTHTFRTGLARRTQGSTAVEILRWEDADVRYMRSREGDTVVCSLQTAVVFPDYYAVSTDWRRLTRLTNANAQQAKESWSPGAKLLEYKAEHGETLRAVLHLPAGYVVGRRYPTLVSIYLIQSDRMHEYRYPSVDGGMVVSDDIPRWTRSGYAVLEPDIQPRLNQAVESALENVLAAVQVGVQSGIVDESRLALEGHSYGAYETSAIVTRTDQFKAAVPLSGVFDLFSTYGSVYELYGGRRVPASFNHESGQVYLAGPWWDHWDAFVENSPLFHIQNVTTPLLLVHGDADTAAPFFQAEEFFNNLRRAGKTNVALLQYRGEGHTFNDPRVLQDLTKRKTEFFEHVLKDGPAPAWWQSKPRR